MGDLIEAYDEFKTVAEYDINFLIMGPAAATDDETSAKARKLIAIAEERKDCIACISPPRGAIVGVSDSDTQTDNLVKFFDPLPSSSYAVFDSGYKYAFNRFTNEFRYIPMNPDVAGLMARTSIDQFSWFSPAGAARGAVFSRSGKNPRRIRCFRKGLWRRPRASGLCHGQRRARCADSREHPGKPLQNRGLAFRHDLYAVPAKFHLAAGSDHSRGGRRYPVGQRDYGL